MFVHEDSIHTSACQCYRLLTHAAVPVWTVTPLTATQLTLTDTQTAVVQYQVTNQSQKSHTLRMRPLPGVRASGCRGALGFKQSCTLNLRISASELNEDLVNGPILCESRNTNQCYEPEAGFGLSIHKGSGPQPPPPSQNYQVTPSGTNVNITPSGAQQVASGGTQQFTVVAQPGYTLSNTVTGTCPIGSWSGSVYITGPITADCTVSFNASEAFATLIVDPTTLSLFIGGGSQIVTVTNNSDLDVENLEAIIPTINITIDPNNTSCMNTLTARATCDYAFLPGTIAEENIEITIQGSNTDPNNPAIVTASVSIASITVEPAALTLYTDGSVGEITVTNTSDIDVTDLTVTNLPADILIAGGSCPTLNPLNPLSPTQSCSFFLVQPASLQKLR